ncbi:hypothetical protein F5J12DRAFT_915549 [Pisolithus orientalis]|uniref:uncharacterized protein n=1 Tax=Pisolithus orientalis TaxID=936130 RepID=UPI0022243629|nr:uncharacterized protein F5J12DRAFT_915549 [Pisolithus orientalis]KAI5992004.1 hypothetical protein F5J12DRAFT_915549 [Pisolithus orientalis]
MSLNMKIQGIFCNIIASQNCQLLTSLVMGSNTLPSDTHAEALAMFSSKKQANYRKLMKGHPPINPAAVKGSHKGLMGSNHQAMAPKSSTIFHVQSVGIVICRIDKDGYLKNLMAPSGKSYWSSIQLMRNCGCFISAAPGAGGIQIDPSWMHPNVNRQLHQWFPQVFNYFDKNPSCKGNRSASLSVTPDWQLLTINHHSFLIIEVTQPNRSTLYENKGCGKACIVVCQRTIPDNIYELWNTEPLVLGSDSKVDSDMSGDSFHGTEIICLSDHNHNGSGSNIDVKLSSLMIELNLHCGDDCIVAKVMDKGKGTERHCLILKTPPPNNLWSCILHSPIQSPPAVKKLKNAGTIIPPISIPQHNSPQAQISSAPEHISISEDDVLLQRCHHPDSPNAGPIVNPWISDSETYTILSLKDLQSFL